MDHLEVQIRGDGDSWYLQSIVLPDLVPPRSNGRVWYCIEWYVAEGARFPTYGV